MPRISIAEVSIEILNYLFDEFDIWAKVLDGRLSSKPLKPTPSKAWSNATSMIIKHYMSNGKHIATTHCIKDDNTGNVLHWDAKDFKLHDVRLWRL